MVAITKKRTLRDFDWVLALIAVSIVAFGTLQIKHAQPTETFWVKQLIGLAIALVAMLGVAFRMHAVVAALPMSAVSVPAASWVAVKDKLVTTYQQERITVILAQENADRRTSGYHT